MAENAKIEKFKCDILGNLMDKIGGKCQDWKNSNETFLVIFKHCAPWCRRSFSLEIIYSRRSIHTIQISRFHEAVLEHLPSPLFDQLAKKQFCQAMPNLDQADDYWKIGLGCMWILMQKSSLQWKFIFLDIHFHL